MTSHTVLGMGGMKMRIRYGRSVKLIRDGCAVQKPFIPFGRFYGIKNPFVCTACSSVRPSATISHQNTSDFLEIMKSSLQKLLEQARF